MTPVLIPRACPVILVNHNGIDVLTGTEVLSSPAHLSKLRLGRMVAVNVGTLPATDELLGRNGLQLVEDGEVLLLGDVLASDELEVLGFGGTVGKRLADKLGIGHAR